MMIGGPQRRRDPFVVVLEPHLPVGDETARLGGKGGALARLVRDGVRVPPTAVVTADAYRDVAANESVVRLISGIAAGETPDAATVDAVFAAAPMSDAVADQIVDTTRLIGDGHGVAVRSSATVEDLAQSSFAGQYRTVLDVDSTDRDEILQAVRRVWASLWHPAPCAYRRALGVDDADAAMSVVVMQMVPATRSGVLFTVDPAGGDDVARVEAVDGLGEQLVSGSVTPEFWLVPRDRATRSSRAGPPDLIRRVVATGLDIERSAGLAQDIEWAAVDDELFIVQARPITVTPPLDDATGDGFDTAVDDHELTTAGIAEMLPGVLPPLRWDIDRFAIEDGFRHLLDDTGAPLARRHAGVPLLRRVRGRAALDLDQLRSMMEHIPGAVDELEAQYFGTPDPSTDADPDDAADADRAQPTEATTSGRRSSLLGGIRSDYRVAVARRRAIDDADIVVAAVVQMRRGRPDLDVRTDEWLLGYLRRLIDLTARGVAAEMVVAAAGVASYRRLELLLEPHLGAERARQVAQDVTSVGDTIVERSPHASAAVIGGPTWIELGLTPPRAEGATVDADDRATRFERLETELTATPGWMRRRVLTGQLIDTRSQVAQRTATDAVEQLRRREEVKAAVLEVGGEIRRVHSALARRLVERGLLGSAADVELLGHAELLDAVRRSRGVAADVLDRRRRINDRYDAAGLLPERFFGDATAPEGPMPTGDRFDGWAASPGRHEAVAQVLRGPSETIAEGAVLVAEATDASWSPLFVRAGAVVVERGGPLSHAAILARELRIPAVLNVPGATRRLDGRTVVVDGDRGMVVARPDDERAGLPEDADQSVLLAGRADRAPIDPFEGVDESNLGVFIPAIMSVGLLFSIGSLLRDAVRWRGRRSRSRRTAMAAAFVAHTTLGTDGDVTPRERGLLPRPAYLVAAFALGIATLYVTVGSTANYTRADGYVGDIAWLLGVSLVVAAMLGFAAGVLVAVFIGWPRPPDWAREPLRHSPLTTSLHPDDAAPPPPWERVAAALGLALATGILTLLVVFGGDDAADFDRPVSSWVRDQSWIDLAHHVDPLGRTDLAVMLAALIGLAALRCRVLGVAYPLTVVAGFVITNSMKDLVDRERPPGGTLAGLTDSFPSGHVTQSMIIVWLLPTAIAVIISRRGVVVPLRVLGMVLVVIAAGGRVDQGAHWPLDVVAGAAIGLVLALVAEMFIDRPHLHRHCGACGWRDVDSTAHRPVPHAPLTPHQLRQIAWLWSALALGAFVVLMFTRGVPTNPEGTGFGSDLETPIQLGLLTFYGLGILITARWTVAGSLVTVVAAVLIGVFASVQYAPVWATGITMVLLVPMFLVWLGWQSRRRWRPIGGLGLASIVLIAATWTGATSLHDFYFGPTHPASLVATVPVDEVGWVWSGGVTPTSATVVVGLTDDERDVRVVADDGTVEVASEVLRAADDESVIRAELTGLQPGTAYDYVVEVDGRADEGRGSGRFTTPVDGPMSFRLAAASCARSGSNGRVFDAIAATDPDMYLALGDIHYTNLSSSDPDVHESALTTLLQRPGQAALYRQVPVAYVWDDHDYGPNDADGSSPSRDAVREAYRRIVPHYPLEAGDGGAIYQAFTIGRVRVIMTDNRSERTATSMLGADQLEWLLDELRTASASHAAVIWANPSPWVGAANPESDTWARFDDERRVIADAIAEAGIDDLVMVSGDAHMVAIDDGTNTDYSTDQVGGFPLLHAAPLDRPGNVKGGPYSDGTFSGSGQFGTIDVVDDGGDEVEIVLTGRNWEGDTLVRHVVTIDASTVE